MRALLCASLAAIALCACPSDPRDAEAKKVVGRVGTVELRAVTVLAAFTQRGVARVADPSGRSQVATAVLERLVEDQLLLSGAESAGITVADDEVEREVRRRAEGYPPGTFQRVLAGEQLTHAEFRDRVRARLVIDAFLRARLSRLPPVDEVDVRARYDKLAPTLKQPEAVRARQVLVRTKEEASHILEQLRGKKLTMEEAAQRFSTAPESERGGDLGWFASGDMPEVFDLCFLLETNQVSEVVASDYGFHIFQTLEKRPARTEPYEAARERLEQDLAAERQTVAVRALLDELRKLHPVRIDSAGFERVLAMVPVAPPQPTETIELDVNARALDAHVNGPPLPELPKTKSSPRPPADDASPPKNDAPPPELWP